MRVRRDIFMTYRALAEARAQLAPVCTERAITMTAHALADGKAEAVAGLRPLLDDAELTRVLDAAAALRQARDVATFDRVVRGWKGAVVSFARDVAKIARWTMPRQRPPGTNR